MIRLTLCFMMSAGAAFACDETGKVMTSALPTAPQINLDVGDIPLAEPFSMRVTVCSGNPLEDLTIDAVMPAHKHGMNYKPEITALGKGIFQADNMLFHMPGHWQVELNAKVGTKQYSYSADILLK